MEAIANYAFNPTEPDELGFEKGSTLYITGMDEDPNWYKARQGNREGMVPANYISMYSNSWYIPKCSRREAEARLTEIDPVTNKDVQSDGAFILRQSENEPGQFSISVKESNSVLHFRVFSDPNGKYYIWSNKFGSINDLIDYHRHHTIYGVKELVLKDCLPSKKFGKTGYGPNATFDNPRLQQSSESRVSHTAVPLTNNDSFVPQNPTSVHNNACNLPPGIIATSLAGRYCVAKFDFNAEFREEMSFRRGHRLRILGEEDENWWYAELINSSGATPSVQPNPRGLIPANYVELLPPNSGNSTNSVLPDGRYNQSRVSQSSASNRAS